MAIYKPAAGARHSCSNKAWQEADAERNAQQAEVRRFRTFLSVQKKRLTLTQREQVGRRNEMATAELCVRVELEWRAPAAGPPKRKHRRQYVATLLPRVVGHSSCTRTVVLRGSKLNAAATSEHARC